MISFAVPSRSMLAETGRKFDEQVEDYYSILDAVQDTPAEDGVLNETIWRAAMEPDQAVQGNFWLMTYWATSFVRVQYPFPFWAGAVTLAFFAAANVWANVAQILR